MKFDFHCHSHYSDGLLSPAELIEYAEERGIELLALTDHDSIDGIALAQDSIQSSQAKLRLIGGVEISALTAFGEIHIVGLNVDVQNGALKAALKEQQDKRWQRAEDMNVRLAKVGVVGVLDACKKDVIQVITRSHMATAIVSLGYAKDRQQAFKKYIGKKGRIKVPKNWMTIEDAIALINGAGGISILAHPTRYPLSNRQLGLLIAAFKLAGGEALELAYPSLNKDKRDWLLVHLEKHNLLASSGSDFHYPNLKWTDLGRFPVLDDRIPHVLNQLNLSLL